MADSAGVRRVLGSERAVVAASAAVVTGLAVSAVLTVSAIDRTRDRFALVEQARTGVLRYEAVREAVSREAFAEAAYRRAPNAVTRTELLQALASVPLAVEDLRLSADPRDQAVARQIAVLNDRYAAEVEKALRPGTTAPPVAVDDRVAGPALDAMGQLVTAGVAGRRADAAVARDQQKAQLGRLAVQLPILFGVVLLVVLASTGLIVRLHRQLAQRARRTEWESLHDPLTGLANRTLLWQELGHRLAGAAPDCALLLIDLDGFKEVNDTFGHEAGDAVLVEVAARLRAQLPPGGLAVRLGGDEFAVVTSVGAARSLAEVLDADLHAPVRLPDGREVSCGGSVGTALARAGEDPVHLLRTADAAMYAVKAGAAGRSRAPRARQAPDAGPRRLIGL